MNLAKWLFGSKGGWVLMLSIGILVSAHILHVKSLKAENALLASNNSKLITAAEAKDDTIRILQEELWAHETTHALREAALHDIRNKYEAIRKELALASRTDQELEDWGRTPLPHLVRSLLVSPGSGGHPAGDYPPLPAGAFYAGDAAAPAQP